MLASRSYVTLALKQAGLQPNRNLGQNFFIDGEYLARLLSSVSFSGKQVVEIGPGLGAMTELLLEAGADVIAIEKDKNMVALLKQALSTPALTIMEGDCLKLWPETLPPLYIVAGNLPYCITAEIAEMLFNKNPAEMVLMLQKEAADRFFALPSHKNYGPLSAAFSLYYRIEMLGSIPPSCYLPEPNVTSAMLHFTKKTDAPGESPGEVLRFFTLCFRMRRKTLLNNLSAFPAAKAAIETLSLPPAVRAEALAPEMLLQLYRYLQKERKDT